MSGKITSLSLLALLACGAAACDDGPGGRGEFMSGSAGGKADDVEGDTDGAATDLHPEHREAVLACQEDADRLLGRTNAARHDAVLEIERGLAGCVAQANDDILPAIDGILGDRSSQSLGLVDAQVERLRQSREDVCGILLDASEEAMSKEGVVLRESCTARSEVDLADLIGVYVDLGVDQEDFVASRVRYPECWTAYDAAIEDAAIHGQKVEAGQDLYGCIVGGNDDARERLAAAIHEQFPGRTMESLDDEVYNTIRQHRSIVTDLCEMFVAAGPTTLDADVELAEQQCWIAGEAAVGHLGDLVVPGMWPEGDESGDPTADGDDDDDDDDEAGGSTGGDEDEAGGSESGGE